MARTPQLIYLLPRLHLTFDEDEYIQLAIAKAQVLADNALTWSDILKMPRPAWLDIFRDFHPIWSRELVPGRGALLTSDDPQWLEEHIDRVVAVLYVLSQDDEYDDNRAPAEAFEYYPVVLGDNPAHPLMVRLKDRRLLLGFPAQGSNVSERLLSAVRGGDTLISNAQGFQVYPPLALYGRGLQEHRLEPDVFVLEGLTRQFARDPYDRIVVACYHLFRTQFASDFTSPRRQDYAAYCACLEATLLIDKHQDRDLGRALVARVQERFPDIPAFAHWLEGLYIERSIFNHGLSPSARIPPEKLAALRAFRQRTDNWATLREICLALIHDHLHALQGHAADSAYWYLSKRTYRLLRRVFASDQYWIALRRHLAQPRSAEAIMSYGEGKQRDFLAVCRTFVNDFEWRYVQEWPAAERVMKVLMAVVLTAMKAGASGEDRVIFDQLGQAATAGDRAGIEEWAEEHDDWLHPDDYDEEDAEAGRLREQILNELKGVAAKVAAYVMYTVGA